MTRRARAFAKIVAVVLVAGAALWLVGTVSGLFVADIAADSRTWSKRP